MDRTTLISYAYMFDGEYNKILDAIQKQIKPTESALKQAVVTPDKAAITIFDETYPKKLFELKNPPFVLFCKGDISLLNKGKINAVVGARQPSDYASNATKDLCNKLNSDGVTVVSGLAKGIDAVAHAYAQQNIAVLGCGINYVYPIANKQLFQKIENSGLIISEYPGLTKPLAYHFPFRNRIVAGLSDRVYAMECQQKSGTLITINNALELGKEIKVLPFDVYSTNYNNELIAEGAGVIGHKDMFEFGNNENHQQAQSLKFDSEEYSTDNTPEL